MCFRSPKRGQSEQRRGSDAHSMHLRHHKTKVKRNDLQYYSVIWPNWYTFTNPINQEMRRWPRITKKSKKTSLFLKGSIFLAAAFFTHWQVWPHLNFRMGFNDAGPGEDIMAKRCTRITQLKFWIENNSWKHLKTIEKAVKMAEGWKFRFFFKAANQSASPTTTSAVASFNIGLRWPPSGAVSGNQLASKASSLDCCLFCTSTNEDTPPITSLPWCCYTIIIKAFCL